MRDPNTYGQAANESPEAAVENAWAELREAIRDATPTGETRRRAAHQRYDALCEQTGRRALEDPDRFENRAPLLHDFAAEAIETMWLRAKKIAKPISTPFPAFSAAIGGGWWPGAYVLSSTTGAGKSQFALQCAVEAAMNQVPVLYIGLELDKEQVVARLMSLMSARRDPLTAPFWSNLYLGKDPTALEKAAGHIPSIPRLFHMEFAPAMRGWSADNLATRVRQMRQTYPEEQKGSRPLFIVLDYLQVVGSREGQGRQELRERIADAVYAARQAARDYNVVVLTISSISRENAKVLGNPKTMFGFGEPDDFVGYGKESGEIEYSADGVFTMAAMGAPDSDGKKTVGMALAKLRMGRATWSYFTFNGSWFDPREAPPPPPKPPRQRPAGQDDHPANEEPGDDL